MPTKGSWEYVDSPQGPSPVALPDGLLDREIDPAFARRARIILGNLELADSLRVLDLGCGRGFYSLAVAGMAKGLSVVGVDRNERYLRRNSGRGAAMLCAVAESLPYRDETFDRVICSEILEHVADDEAVLAEMARVLKRGGSALITVPARSYPFLWDPLNFALERVFHRHIPAHIWWLAGIWADHHRLYDERELTDKLERSGLRVRRVWRSTSASFPFSHFLLYGIGKNLVERGLVGKSFDRFEQRPKPSPLARAARNLFLLVDRFNAESEDKRRRFVNLIFKVDRI